MKKFNSDVIIQLSSDLIQQRQSSQINNIVEY